MKPWGIAYEPPLAFIVDLPPGRIVARRTVEAPWRVMKVRGMKGRCGRRP